MKDFKVFWDMKILFLLLVIVVLFLSGCGGSEIPDPVIDKEDFKKGVHELKMEFQENAPPKKIYDDSNFRVIPKISNTGAYDIKEGILVLNTETEYVKYDQSGDSVNQGSNVYEFKNLAGKSFLNPEGDHLTPTFDLYARSLEATSSEHTVGVYATTCYDYETELTDELCVDPDLYNERDVDKPCSAGAKTSSGQGAPVAITSVELELIPRADNNYQVQLLIEIQDKGDGKPINPKKLNEVCSSGSFESKDINVVYLEEVRFMGGKYNYKGRSTEEDYDDETGNLKCTNDPLYLSTTPGKNIIKCRGPETSDLIGKNEPVKLSQIYIKLDYGYMITESAKVAIENGDY